MSKKDDLVSSRPMSPSDFLQFPVDETKECVGVDASDLAALDHPFSSPPRFLDDNNDSFDPFSVSFHSFAQPFLDSTKIKRNGSSFLRSGFCHFTHFSPDHGSWLASISVLSPNVDGIGYGSGCFRYGGRAVMVSDLHKSIRSSVLRLHLAIGPSHSPQINFLLH